SMIGSCEGSRFRMHRVANEVAMRGELVIQAPGAVVVQPRMPVKPGPALALHFLNEPGDHPLADSGSAARRIDEEVAEVAGWSQPERVLVDDIVRDADDAGVSILGDDRIHWRRIIHDACPRVPGERLRWSALVE